MCVNVGMFKPQYIVFRLKDDLWTPFSLFSVLGSRDLAQAVMLGDPNHFAGPHFYFCFPQKEMN